MRDQSCGREAGRKRLLLESSIVAFHSEVMSALMAEDYDVVVADLDAASTPAKLAEHTPQLVVLSLDGENAERVAEIASALHESDRVPFACISRTGDAHILKRAGESGPRFILLEPFSVAQLALNLDLALNRDGVRSRMPDSFPIAQRQRDDNDRISVAELSPREKKICLCIQNGLISKEIAREFGVTAKTIAFHRANIRKKLGLEGRATRLDRWLMDHL